MTTILFPLLFISAAIVALLLNATPPAVLLAHAATCTSTSSPGGTFTDPTSTFVGCTISGWADFDFGSVVSTVVALSLFVSGSTVQLGQRLSIAGFAGLTAHRPLNATIVDSTFSNSALRIAGTFPSGTTITVLRTAFTLLDVKLSVGQNTGGGGGYLNPNIFFSSVVLRDGSQFRVSQSTISNIKNAASTYNIVTIHVMANTDLTLSNQSSVVFSDTSILSRSQGGDPSTYHVLVLRVYMQSEGRGNVVEFSRCNLTGYSDSGHVTSYFFASLSATPGWADAPTLPAGTSSMAVLELPTTSGLLAQSQITGSVFQLLDAAGIRAATTAFIVSGCRFNQYGAYNGFPTRFGFAPGTFALFENNYAFGNRGTVFGIESQNLFSIEQVQNVSVLMRRNTFDASANLMRQAVSVSGPTWQHLNLILYLNRALLNSNGLLLLGTPSLPGGVTSTPISLHMIQNTVTGSATARPLLEGYTAPHEAIVVCRNRYYGTMLADRAQYVSGTGVTNVPSAAGAALRYRCSTQTVDIPSQTRTLKITNTMSVSAPPLTVSNTHAFTSSKSIGGTTSSQTVTGTQMSAAVSSTVSPPRTASVSASQTNPGASVSTSQTDSQLTRSTLWTPSHTLTRATPIGNTPTGSGPVDASPSRSPDISASRSPAPFKTNTHGPSSTAHVPGTFTGHTASLLVSPTHTHAADQTTTLSKSLPGAVSPTHLVILPGMSPMTTTVEPTHSPLCSLLAEPATAHAWLAPSPNDLIADTLQVVFRPPPTTQEAAMAQETPEMPTHQTIQWRASDAATIAAQLPSGTALSNVLEGACALRDNRVLSTSTSQMIITCTVSGRLVWTALRVFPDHTTSMQATVVTGPCGRSLTLALLLQPTAVVSGASLVVTVIVAAAVSTALFTAIVDPTAIDAQLITLVLLSVCSQTGGASGGGAARVSRYLLSPIIDLGPATVALAHTGAGFSFAALHILAAVVTARRRRIPFQEACSLVHFPSVSFSVSSVLYAGAAWGTAGAIHNIQQPSGGTFLDGVAVVCAVCLLLLPEPVLCACALLRTTARRHRFVLMKTDTDADNESHRRPCGSAFETAEAAALTGARLQNSTQAPQLAQWLCVPHGAWRDEIPAAVEGSFSLSPSSIRSLRGLAGPRAPLLHVVTRLQFLLCCALVTAPPRSGACKGRLLATAAILVASAAAFAVTRPFRVHAVTALSAALALATALLAASIAVESDAGLTNAAIVLTSVFAVLRGAHTAFVLAWEQCHPLTDPSESNPNNTALLEMA